MCLDHLNQCNPTELHQAGEQTSHPHAAPYARWLRPATRKTSPFTPSKTRTQEKSARGLLRAHGVCHPGTLLYSKVFAWPSVKVGCAALRTRPGRGNAAGPEVCWAVSGKEKGWQRGAGALNWGDSSRTGLWNPAGCFSTLWCPARRHFSWWSAVTKPTSLAAPTPRSPGEGGAGAASFGPLRDRAGRSLRAAPSPRTPRGVLGWNPPSLLTQHSRPDTPGAD